MKNKEKALGADAAAVDTAGSSDAPQLTHVELDPETWWRARGPGLSRLLRFTDGKRCQCCLGIAATALGAPDDALINRAYPDAVIGFSDPVWDQLITADAASQLGGVFKFNDYACEAVDDEDRVKRINTELASADVSLRFYLKVTAPVIENADQSLGEASGSVPSAAP